MTSPAGAQDRVDAPVLQATDLSVGYGALTVARHLDLAVAPGQVMLLIGPNGAGKTTTLLTLAGALPPVGGRMSWRQRPMSGPIHRRVRDGLGFVPDERGVISALSVRANIRLGRGSVPRVLELFPELTDHLDRRAGVLSGGQQKMLALALAICRDPVVLLADELSLGLAPRVVDRLLGVVREAADRGAAVVLVEQHARQAMKIADTVIVLLHGRIALSGERDAVASDVERLLEQGYLAAP